MQGIAQKILANPAKYSIEQLTQGVQNGVIPAYVGIPLIQEKIKEQKEAQVMSMGQQQQRPVAEQIMQEAQSAGVPALSSNLPQEYAGGGIIAFDEGGPVKHYRDRGLVGIGDPSGMGGSEIMSAAGTANPYVGNGLLSTLVSAPEDPEWKRKLKLEQALRDRDRTTEVVAPAAPPIIPYGQSKANIFGGETTPAAPAAPVAPTIPGAGDFKMPTLPKMKSIDAPALTKYDELIGDMPAKTKEAFEDKVFEVQGIYEAFDKPGNEARESRLTKREAAQEKDSAIGRALNLMSLGFGIAGSKERSLAGALGNEGRQGIADLIRGEAANRAAKDRLEDARDNFEQQKVAAKKGNYQAAQQAGQRAADDLRAGTQLTMTGAHYGNTEANQRLQLQQQGEFQRTSLEQQGILGLSELGLKKDQLNQNAATANAQLQLGREKLGIIKGQIAAGDKRAAAALATAETKAAAAWQTSPQFQQAQMQAKKMAPIEAQRFMQQEWLKYSANAVPSLFAGQGGGASIPSFNDLYKAME
jgi:hypothetical protein